MKNTNEIITKLTEAKTLHERWMSYAEAIYNGVNISEEHTPMMHTDCQFGKWMQANTPLLQSIEAPESLYDDHKNLHKVYMEIFKIMKQESSTNIFNKAKIEAKKKEALEMNFNALGLISKTMLKSIDNLVEKIRSLTNEQIAELV